MIKRSVLLILALALLAGAIPGAMAAQTYTAHTPLSGADSDKLNNLRLAAKAIDGMEIEAGDSFSFNQTVGPREKRRGYRKAPNGRGAMVTGGGVAQAATTLYMALLKMGEAVDIDPVKTYGSRFIDDYVQNPDLAVITDYDAGIDLSFTNLDDDMVIDMWLGEEDLWCVITTGQGGGISLKPSVSGDVPSGSGNDSLSILELYEDFEDEEDELPSGAPLKKPSFDDEEDLYNKSARSDPSRGLSSSYKPLGSACLDCGGDEDVLHNVALAADSLNDTVLDAGDSFSFNDVVGPRTKKYGYRRAINGRGSRVTGGGVAQVASALWLAIKNSDRVTILEKSTYGDRYNQHYVSNAADAILTDYSSGRDFRFRYIGRTSLTVYAYVQGDYLYLDVYEG